MDQSNSRSGAGQTSPSDATPLPEAMPAGDITHTHSHSHTYHHHTVHERAAGSSGPVNAGPSTSSIGQEGPMARRGLDETILHDVSMASIASSRHSASVREALAELNLKTRLLQDERDYYVSLFEATDRAYAHHRNELQSLLLKERAIFATSMRSTESRLDSLREEIRALERRTSDSKDELFKGAQREQINMRADYESRMASVRSEMNEQRSTLELMRKQTDMLMGEKEGLEEEIRELLRRQEMLRSEVVRRRAEQRALKEAGEAPKPFIPGGRTAKEDYVPASHNVNALVSTIHKRNFMLPNDNKRMQSPSVAVGGGAMVRATDEVSANILRELMDLRLEYHLLAQELNKPSTDVTATSARLREILQTVEKKKMQLRNVRDTQKHKSDVEKLHKMLRLIAKKNNMAEKLYSDLLTCIRNPY